MVYVPGLTAPVQPGWKFFPFLDLLGDSDHSRKPVNNKHVSNFEENRKPLRGVQAQTSVILGKLTSVRKSIKKSGELNQLVFEGQRKKIVRDKLIELDLNISNMKGAILGGRKLQLSNTEDLKTVVDLVELVDVFPTLAELASLPAIAQCPETSSDVKLCTEGRSMVPLILNAVSKNRNSDHVLDYLNNSVFSNKNSRKNVSRHDNVMKLSEAFSGRKFDSKKYFISTWKKAAFSQYPRPSDGPELNSDKPKLAYIKIMGYSIRTDKHRYTEWVGFNTSTFKMNWSDIHARELYIHDSDPLENENVAGLKEHQGLVTELSSRLHRGWLYE